MKSLLTSIFFLWTCSLLFAQNKKSMDSICKDSIPNEYYLDQEVKNSMIQEHKKTSYYLIQRAWKANLPPSYVSVAPMITSIGKRRIPLVDGEGENGNMNLLEANLNLSFPLFFGREVGSGRSKRNRISLEYNGNFRMSNDSSKPILPGSHKVGFSWNVNLYNNYTGHYFKDDCSQSKIDSSKGNLKFVNLLIRAHHYSNGQPPGFFFPSDTLAIDQRRNSYSNGDFSTNYIYTEITKGWYNYKSLSLHQISFGYRLDLGTEESTFAYSQQQEDSYGRHRFSASYDYRTNRFGKKKDWHFRGEMGYIVGNLNNFLPNLENNTQKYRFNARGLIEFSPKAHRSVGYMFFLYYGRDYLNIRYDDVIVTAQFGFTVDLDKFFMPKLRYASK